MSIRLLNFQKLAIEKLMNAMQGISKEIIFKSPTGSGKTIVLTHFMKRYLSENNNIVWVWLTPGKGNLEEQSKEKMDKYIHGSKTKLLSDLMSTGFKRNDCVFINWEKLTKKGNKALSEGERTNFKEWINKAINDNLEFKVIIDESHQNFTEKSDEIIQLFKADKIIRCSATPTKIPGATVIEVSEKEVIEEGLIKKLIVTNENFPSNVVTDNQTYYLLEHAYNKQIELRKLFDSKKANVNPLIVVQLPNSNDSLLSSVEEWFVSKGITYENGQLALWLAGKHLNLDNISDNDAKQVAIIIKQAVATGWDCPRAHILVKLRDNMDEVFEIQTVGRIRRMPEAKHYEQDDLDSCYIYTFDEKFIKGVKASLGNGALDACTLFLKNEFKDFSLVKEQRALINDVTDPRLVQKSLIEYLKSKYNLTGDKEKNKKAMQANGYIFEDNIIKYTVSGNVVELADLTDSEKMNAVAIEVPLNTHVHGRDYHHYVAKLGSDVHLEYQSMNTIIQRLFGEKMSFWNKLIKLTTKQVYCFIINNYYQLANDFKDAMAVELHKLTLDLKFIHNNTFKIPQSVLFTYDSKKRNQTEYKKNVYNGYLASAEKRSTGEMLFERWCESTSNVEWFYKNGDKGEEYLSIAYQDNSGVLKLFYPDYVLSINKEVWIIETKGGFSRTGDSQDIDKYTGKKFALLKQYLQKHNLKGGIVRYDANEQELCICQDNYSDDITSESWKSLDSILK
jgi:type III restriction enzyme